MTSKSEKNEKPTWVGSRMVFYLFAPVGFECD